MTTSGEATSFSYKSIFLSCLFKEANDSSANSKMWYPFKRNRRSEERNIFQRTVLFCAGNLESAQILGPGIWNHRNYHHRNNCYKLGSLALICPSARSMRVHIFTEVNILYGIGKMWKKP